MNHTINAFKTKIDFYLDKPRAGAIRFEFDRTPKIFSSHNGSFKNWALHFRGYTLHVSARVRPA